MQNYQLSIATSSHVIRFFLSGHPPSVGWESWPERGPRVWGSSPGAKGETVMIVMGRPGPLEREDLVFSGLLKVKKGRVRLMFLGRDHWTKKTKSRSSICGKKHI